MRAAGRAWSSKPSRARIRLLAVGLGAIACVLAGCGGKSAMTTTTTAATTRGVSHVAPDLEALLPDSVNGTPLRKGSTSGAVVFGGNAFGRAMTTFLAAHGKRPQDLRFANARASSRALEVEVGVFEVRGVDGNALRRAIVASSRPNAPGLTAAPTTLSGKRVTKVVYPGGSVLYLYAHGDRVFYVGTQNEMLAGKILAGLP
jgi:hypothetical protein